MSKFTVLEDGRLNDFEMSSIKGGKQATKDCFKQTYSVTPDCPGNPTGYSTCPIQYMSCTADSYVMCSGANGGYKGPTGPAGLTAKEISPIDGPIVVF